jgi:hypothetical protein
MAVSDARAVYAGYIILLLLSLPRHLWYITNADDATISGDTGSFALASLAGVTVDFFDEALWSAFAALARGDARLSSRLGSAFERKDHLSRLGKNGRGRCKLKWMRVGGVSSEGGSWEPADQLTAAHPVVCELTFARFAKWRARLLRSLYKARARLADRQIRRLADRQIRRRAGAVLQNAFVDARAAEKFAADALRLRALYTARDARLADTAAAPTAALQQPDVAAGRAGGSLGAAQRPRLSEGTARDAAVATAAALQCDLDPFVQKQLLYLMLCEEEADGVVEARMQVVYACMSDGVQQEFFILRRLAVLQDRQAEAYNAVLSNTLKRKRVSGAKAAEYHKVFQPSLGTPPP